ncbi:putative annexin [Helianthus annuus]|uniref:Annexin n=1 Tax=Helianthus annuus TaxID=4232 RepID=A0A251VJK1_HELAN|nr:annexin D5 isoform X1 [Helianthus annuus]KAF5819944.1 putative annexin [Helianthus annuus]KAJ0620047.1 putative annexin [Helianthus annuus]KAJ0778506.1 putative annexin [Helianthus annuus]KAJ0941458.1 putative annexin [Helianthus annuus]
MATLTVPPVPLSPRDDAIQLHKAFKGFGCDTAAVIGILAHRDATQRACIRQEYETMYSEDILKRLSSELSGKLETAVLLWMHDPAGRDAVILKQGLTSDFLNLEAVTEIICSRTSTQLLTLTQIYHSTFGSHLEHDIKRQASGDHEKILLACVNKPRYEGMEVDREMAAKDAKELYKAGEKKLGTDEKVFVQIFSERSRAHLVAINTCYHDMYGGSLKKAVKKETSGLFKSALLTILQCAENPTKYFAKVLHKSMAGLGTDDTTLIRVIVTRTEIDMQYIKAEYHKKYKKSLNDAVHSETSGHYQTFLLSLLGPNH